MTSSNLDSKTRARVPSTLRASVVEPGVGRDAVDLVASLEQLERRVPRAAADVENRAHARGDVGHQLVRVAGLGQRHVLRRQLEVVGPVAVMKVLHVEREAPDHEPEGQSEFGRLERGLPQRVGYGVGRSRHKVQFVVMEDPESYTAGTGSCRSRVAARWVARNALPTARFRCLVATARAIAYTPHSQANPPMTPDS